MANSKLLVACALGFFSLSNAVKYGHNNRPLRQDNEQTLQFFPEPNITLIAPAFEEGAVFPDGWYDQTAGPTDDATVDRFIATLAQRNSWMTYRKASFQSEEGRSFPYVYLTKQDATGEKVRVWIQGAAHGDEPAGDQAALALLGKLDAEPEWASSLLDVLDITVLPRYNPDGVHYFQRVLATNFDPNRDHIKLARQQTRDIKSLLGEFAPHIIVDMHEFGATSRYLDDLVHASDALFSAAKNLNIHPDIRDMSETLFAPKIGEDLEAAGFRWEPYVTESESDNEGVLQFAEAGSDAKIGRNAMGLTQSITFLFEMRGIFLADQEFKRRTACGLTMIESVLNTAAENHEEVYSGIESAIQDFVESTEDIVVTDYTEVTNRNFQMINAENGTLVNQPIEFRSTTPVTANVTRSRPSAYIIPKAWPDIAERLRVAGLEVQEIPFAFQGTVGAYNITASKLASSIYEGTVLTTVSTELIEREITLPAGSFRVNTNQRNAALAFVALEPENIDSYVSFNIIPMEKGDEYPIFRLS